MSQPYAPGSNVYWTFYTYDGLARMSNIYPPDGASFTYYSYSGNTVTVTDPAGHSKTFTRDAWGNLTKVQEPDPSLGTTVGAFLLSATNPETGTITYTYNSDSTVHTKTDAKGQQFTYSYDSYKRVTQVSVGGNSLRTFMYDNNTLDTSFSGSYTAGRLVAVQNAQVNHLGINGTIAPTGIQFTEMYGYTQPGQASKKRLQVNETLRYGSGQNVTRTLNLDAAYTYDNEGKVTSVNDPTTYDSNQNPTAGPTYTYSLDSLDRPVGLTDNAAVSAVTYNPENSRNDEERTRCTNRNNPIAARTKCSRSCSAGVRSNAHGLTGFQSQRLCQLSFVWMGSIF